MVKFMSNKRAKIVIVFMLVAIITTMSIFMCFIRKSITVIVDGNPIKLVTCQKTFDSALKRSDITIDVNDKINKALTSKITNNDIITINRAVNLKVFVDNKELNIKSAEKDIAQMLKDQKIAISPSDKVSPSIATKLTKGMDITITRIQTQTVHQLKPIEFKTVIKKDNKILKSKSNISQDGIKGQKNITLSVIYENGKEVTRKVIKETLIKKPQNKIIVQGTMPDITFSRGSSIETSDKITNVKAYSEAPNAKASGKTFQVRATAYWAFGGVNNTYTYSGRKAVRNPNGYSTIAVDPNRIPIGTKLYVEGYGNAIAADKGSGVKGDSIDVFFNTKGEASNWGVKYLTVQLQD